MLQHHKVIPGSRGDVANDIASSLPSKEKEAIAAAIAPTQ